jgi:hypothetical protein
MNRSLASWLVGGLALTAAACPTAKETFYGTVFPCDVKASEDQCGTTSDGKPMVCYNGARVGGGSDFCAPGCDPTSPSPDAHSLCTSTGALLRVCQPIGADDDPERSCPEGLHCFRTDLFKNEGVCLMMNVCDKNEDCPGSERTACASSILGALPRPLHADHLHCVNPECSTENSCGTDESCLSTGYVVDKALNICVPNCDSKGHCPPAFACAQTSAAKGSPAMCLPGLPGVRCESDLDCVLGTCFDTGAGFSECVFSTCTVDQDCAPFALTTTSVCVGGEAGGTGHCLATKPFNGADCDVKRNDCPEGQACIYYSPYVIDQEKGECRVPCDANKKCPARGGVPHVCLDDGDGGCYPGVLGMPCLASSECVGHLQCLPAAPDARTIVSSPNICTVPCGTDADCTGDPLCGSGSFCADGLCRITGGPGMPCTTNTQCSNRVCLATSICA